MTRLKPGDRVSCYVKDSKIVVASSEYDEIITFEIVAVSGSDYYLFVPHYVNIKNTIPIDAYRCKKMDIDLRFLGEQMILIEEDAVYQIVQRLDGMTCAICETFCKYAAPNQEGDFFVCFSCRQNPYH